MSIFFMFSFNLIWQFIYIYVSCNNCDDHSLLLNKREIWMYFFCFPQTELFVVSNSAAPLSIFMKIWKDCQTDITNKLIFFLYQYWYQFFFVFVWLREWIDSASFLGDPGPRFFFFFEFILSFDIKMDIYHSFLMYL